MKTASLSSLCWRALVGLALVSMLAACATGPRIRTDADPTADFSQYRTYGFYQPLAMEQSGYTSYLSDHIKNAVRREMDARGYRFSPDKADLLVNFQGVIREKTDVYDVPRSDIQYFYSYRARAYYAYPVWYDETRVNQYTEGTLTVDLVDAARNRLVWSGDAIGRVTQKTPQQRAASADQAITAIFAKYPYRGAP
ncbi:DUF4136 domain-containing protein [Novilysobacter antarcticus]|uniref:DUF4136 domain-containing protein n=1 Tax=Novilysobacter antarcticus TaxID=2862543 RepID=UPI001C99269C|nr:DUF4136 domain-containing protein [Lysobacter antarcticus]